MSTKEERAKIIASFQNLGCSSAKFKLLLDQDAELATDWESVRQDMSSPSGPAAEIIAAIDAD